MLALICANTKHVVVEALSYHGGCLMFQDLQTCPLLDDVGITLGTSQYVSNVFIFLSGFLELPAWCMDAVRSG